METIANKNINVLKLFFLLILILVLSGCGGRSSMITIYEPEPSPEEIRRPVSEGFVIRSETNSEEESRASNTNRRNLNVREPITTTSQNNTLDIIDSDGDRVEIYSGSYALLIGASNYQGWNSLPSVPNELREVKSVLLEQNFNVSTLFDPNIAELENSIKDFIRKYGYQDDNRLIIYFSGHGHTWPERNQGYLVPIEAPLPISDKNPGQSFLKSVLHISQMVEWSRQMTARHALFVFDSCFSGTVFNVSRAEPAKAKPSPNFILNSAIRPVRQFISSGKAGEKVPAKSIFTPAFVEAIRFGKGDLNNDGYITGAELGLHLQQLVPQFKNQTPQFDNHPDYTLSRGDFIFVN